MNCEKSETKICHVCQSSGDHWTSKCPNIICIQCREKGHAKIDCIQTVYKSAKNFKISKETSNIICVEKNINFDSLTLNEEYQHHFIKVEPLTDRNVRFGEIAKVIKYQEFPKEVILVTKEVRFVLPKKRTFITILINDECKKYCESDIIKCLRIEL